MKISIFKPVFVIAIAGACLFSCVPARQLEEMKTKKEKTETENAQLKKENQEFTAKLNELQSALDILTQRVNSLQIDSTVRGTTLRTMTSNYDQLNKTYQQLLANNKDLLSGNINETQKILRKLQTTQDSLQNKEDALKKLSADLDAKKLNLDNLSQELESSKSELSSKEAKLAELQAILDKKDSVVKALKNKVTDALTGYEGKGLTISQKNGKIYVSLEESLLFASGSFTVDPKGIEAIKKLSKVLETNTDINVLIEGHTDNVPYGGTGALKDNWDLSAMRATAIVKIITSNSNVNPKRLTAAGKSEYDPVDINTTKDGRAKNRRTEIILTPKMDELFQIIEQN
ncbi:MAG: OmpA family protein [Bacteroidetes bacterium]|nr:OmpA family protein [Bacteroidota bacterium]